MSKKKKESAVKVGQRWRDKDPRMEGRTLRVKEIIENGEFAICEPVGDTRRRARYVRIQVAALPKRFTLVA